MRRARSTAGLLAAALLVAAGAAAQEAGPPDPAIPDAAVAEARDEELDALAADIGNRLRCPVCRQQSVTESPSQIAREMQALIREKLAAGETPDEIVAYFVDAYGEWILLQPTARGANLLVYVLPALAFLAGLIFLAVRWRRMRKGREAPPGHQAGGRGAPETAAGGEPELRGGAGGPEDPGEEEAEPLDEDDRAWIEAAVRGGA